MASVDRIKGEIVALEQSAMAIGQELRSAYTQYLTAFTPIVQQQLILACYRLCTQGYPDRFLKLSFSERQMLQQALRQLGQQATEQLMLPLQEPSEAASEVETADDRDESKASVMDLNEAAAADELEAAETDLLSEGREELAIGSDDSEDSEDSEDEDELELEESELEVTIVQLRFDQPLPPEALQQWREGVERNIVIVLRTISQAANQLLHRSSILPKPIPPVLEVAAQSGLVAEGPSNTPNLLNLLIETGEQEEARMTQIIAVRLRLAEIEYAEPLLTSARSQLRSLAARLQQLERNYRKKQRDRSVAEAEAAWRSSWFDE